MSNTKRTSGVLDKQFKTFQTDFLIQAGIEKYYTKGKFTGKFNHPPEVEEQIEIMRQNREEIPVLREKVSSKLKREKEVAEAEAQLSKDYIAMAEHPDQHPKLKTILLRISELNNIVAGNRYNMHAQISLINEEWKKWETFALKEIRIRQDQLNHTWCEIKFWRKKGDHAKLSDCESRYKILTSEFVNLIHDIRKKKEEDIPTWLLAILQHELEFFSVTINHLAQIEEAIRSMGPVQSIEMPGLEKFQPTFRIENATPQLMLPPSTGDTLTPRTTNPTITVSEHVGVLPPSPRGNPVRNVKAIYNFDASTPGELTFKVGDEFTITSEPGGGWLNVKNRTGLQGLVPANYVVPM